MMAKTAQDTVSAFFFSSSKISLVSENNIAKDTTGQLETGPHVFNRVTLYTYIIRKKNMSVFRFYIPSSFSTTN